MLQLSRAAAPLPFHPTSISQLAALHLARRFDDLKRLPQYLHVCEQHTLADVLAAATAAHEAEDRSPEHAGDLFLRRFGTERQAL